MTADQFRALCTLLRSPPGPAQEAARLVLVEQMRPSDAAALAGVSPASVSNAVTRFRRGQELAARAALEQRAMTPERSTRRSGAAGAVV